MILSYFLLHFLIMKIEKLFLSFLNLNNKISYKFLMRILAYRNSSHQEVFNNFFGLVAYRGLCFYNTALFEFRAINNIKRAFEAAMSMNHRWLLLVYMYTTFQKNVTMNMILPFEKDYIILLGITKLINEKYYMFCAVFEPQIQMKYLHNSQ